MRGNKVLIRHIAVMRSFALIVYINIPFIWFVAYTCVKCSNGYDCVVMGFVTQQIFANTSPLDLREKVEMTRNEHAQQHDVQNFIQTNLAHA